ncbi:MAG: LolA family protein [Thermoanaerobaculia bacterium]
MGFPAFLLLASLAAGDDPATQLAKAARYFQDGKAHEAEFVQTFTPVGFNHGQEESGTVLVQGPENLRFQYGPPSSKVFTFDGSTARFFTPGERQMIVRRLSEEDRAQLPLIFLESPAEVAKLYTLSLEPHPEGSAILLTPKSADAEVAWIRLSLSGGGAPAGLSFQGSTGDRTEFQFKDFRALPAREASDFTIHPPAGTRIVENGPL